MASDTGAMQSKFGHGSKRAQGNEPAKEAASQKHYQLAESFWSIQGEGANAGRSAIFLRLQGCPVGCPWCDSKLTWYAGGTPVTTNELLGLIYKMPFAELLIITGGEPLIYDLDLLISELRATYPGREVHLETSGAYPFKGHQRPDWVTLSPKWSARPSWHVDPSVLEVAAEFKFVCDEQIDRRIIQQYQRQTKWRVPVYIMPEGSPPRPEMVQKALAMVRDYCWRFSPRLQYAYPSIGEGEGVNNKIITVDVARQRAHEHVKESSSG